MNMPRVLPLVGVAVAGVLAVKAISGVTALPDMLQGAKAWAEGKVPAKTQDAGAPPASGSSANPVLPPGLSPTLSASPAALAAASAQQSQPAQPKIACTPSAADLAREAGLSPAELAVLQSLQGRRGQLDQREQDLDVQLQLIAAAQAKLDTKLQALASMKTDLQGLLDKADAQKSTEVDRLVIVYSKMKPAAAAQRFTLLDDSVRIPIAAKMKEAALSAIIALMPAPDAKALTEKLAHRFDSKSLNDAKAALAPASATPAAPAPPAIAQAAAQPPATPAAAPTAPADKPKKVAKARPRKAKATAVAANAAAPPAGTPPAKPAAAPANAPAQPPAQAPAAAPATTPAAAPAKSG
jgi:flagellar motility protein MotE (MotC chaperone)